MRGALEKASRTRGSTQFIVGKRLCVARVFESDDGFSYCCTAAAARGNLLDIVPPLPCDADRGTVARDHLLVPIIDVDNGGLSKCGRQTQKEDDYPNDIVHDVHFGDLSKGKKTAFHMRWSCVVCLLFGWFGVTVALVLLLFYLKFVFPQLLLLCCDWFIKKILLLAAIFLPLSDCRCCVGTHTNEHSETHRSVGPCFGNNNPSSFGCSCSRSYPISTKAKAKQALIPDSPYLKDYFTLF